MMSSSPDPRGSVLTADHADQATVRAIGLSHRELRTGGWTRLGSSAVLGDQVTEHALSALAAETRDAARAQGYSTGWAEGRRAAEQRAAEQEQQVADQHRQQEERREVEHQAAVQALLRAAAELDQALAATCARVESHVVDVAVELTEELLGHELAVAETPGLDAVRRALALVPGEPVVRIRVAVEEAGHPLLAELAGAATVVGDPSLRRGDALVETGTEVVDARVSGALQRVREVLLP
jgi:flagellar assembly protein FliH